jgi:hypothetical protein
MWRAIGLRLSVVVGLLAPGALSADVVVLKDGERIEGVVEERGDEVVVRLDYGDVGFARSEVARVERRASPLSRFEARAAGLTPRDVNGRYRLGLEAERAGLTGLARRLFLEVVSLEPDHRGARAALGQRLHGGRWRTEDEVKEAEGYVKRGDLWITPGAAAVLDAEARREAEAAQRLEDARKIAALEARVARAEADARAAREAERGAEDARVVGVGGFGGVGVGPSACVGLGCRLAKGQAVPHDRAQARGPAKPNPATFGVNGPMMDKLARPMTTTLPPPGVSR